mmetsp:Transcript_72356/g.130216  ORF Transcript_72356/g.130216 Transcript_72356/m.130216 type:complete len:217 (+) Transcript_72356:139-789(+)
MSKHTQSESRSSQPLRAYLRRIAFRPVCKTPPEQNVVKKMVSIMSSNQNKGKTQDITSESLSLTLPNAILNGVISTSYTSSSKPSISKAIRRRESSWNRQRDATFPRNFLLLSFANSSMSSPQSARPEGRLSVRKAGRSMKRSDLDCVESGLSGMSSATLTMATSSVLVAVPKAPSIAATSSALGVPKTPSVFTSSVLGPAAALVGVATSFQSRAV